MLYILESFQAHSASGILFPEQSIMEGSGKEVIDILN